MSDLEVLKTMFDRAAIAYREEGGDKGGGAYPVEGTATTLTIYAAYDADQAGNRGYTDFRSVAYFNEDRSLKAWGAWE